MSNQSKIEARKEQILTAAQKVFAEKGFHEATISEVAKVAGVSEATIYEYFSNKEALLFSIPLETTRRGYEQAEYHLKLIKGAGNKLRASIYLYLQFYQDNPDYAAVIMLILKQNRKFQGTEAYKLIVEGFQGIVQILEDGIKSNELRSDINPYLVRSVILGTIEHLVTNWLLTGRPEELLDSVDPLCDFIMEGIEQRDFAENGKRNRHWSAWISSRHNEA